MDKEKILLEELNKLGNFTNVKEEFNNGQLNAIYGAMKQVKNNVVLADVIVTKGKICDIISHNADIMMSGKCITCGGGKENYFYK